MGGGWTYGIELEEPGWAWDVEVHEDFVEGDDELFEHDVDTVAPAAAVVGVEGEVHVWHRR